MGVATADKHCLETGGQLDLAVGLKLLSTALRPKSGILSLGHNSHAAPIFVVIATVAPAAGCCVHLAHSWSTVIGKVTSVHLVEAESATTVSHCSPRYMLPGIIQNLLGGGRVPSTVRLQSHGCCDTGKLGQLRDWPERLPGALAQLGREWLL